MLSWSMIEYLSAKILTITRNATENIRKLISSKCEFELIESWSRLWINRLGVYSFIFVFDVMAKVISSNYIDLASKSGTCAELITRL